MTSVSQIRNKKGQFLKGYNGLAGFKHSEESKRKISETLRKSFRGGEWKPGIGKKFEIGHEYYPLSKEGLLAKRGRMSGEKNPAKRPEVRAKIGLKTRGNKGRLGLPHLEETRNKISETHRGKKKPWAGKFLTEDGRRRISESSKGEKNNFWKGGISSLYAKIRNLSEYSQWRSDIFKRDKFTCQICGVKGGYLEVDHYPKMRSEIMKEYNIKSVEDALICTELWSRNNGRTLCRPCHDKTKYGRSSKQL